MPGRKVIRRQSSAPATKQDIATIMDSIGKLYDATEQWKNEMIGQMSKWKHEMQRYFDVKCEQLTHDFQGVLKDKISVHDDHLARHDRELHAVRLHVGMEKS